MNVTHTARRLVLVAACTLAALAPLASPAAEAKKEAAVAAEKAKAEAEKKAAEEMARKEAALAAEKAKAEEAKRRVLLQVRDAKAARAAIRIEAAPAGRKIFVPQPKGTGETLDDSAKDGKKPEGDTVTTIRGDRVVGKVMSIDAGGKLRLTAPHFEGEVVVLASALERVDLHVTESASGGDEVALTNGDRVLGEVVGITPEHVIIESKATGPVKISRKVIETIAFAQGRTMLLESHFASGRMAPWTAKGSGWSVSGGALQCSSSGSRQTIHAPFEQSEAVTMIAHVEATSGRYLNCELILFAERADGSYGHNSVVARFYSSQFYLMYARNGGTNSVINRSVNTVMRNGVVRLAYDPATSKARVWIDSRDLGEYTIPHKITAGKFVMFGSRYPCRVTQMRVVRGIVGPTSTDEKSENKTHIIRFGNKDRVAAEEVTLADAKLRLKTSFGEIASDVDKVQSIAFRSTGIEKPRRHKGDVYVETADSRFTLQFESLSPEHLVGKSAYLGQVKIRRSALKRIRFNIYK
ncbi:MAG: hypothetical protein ISS72_01195 [Candidatus Brocadiae bacterium]|nr:hypothetical protein [Candidatus Brocadiia bacterium]